MPATCPANADDRFGPRVNTNCRQFDFTPWFEDAFFTLLPAAVFLLLFPWRLRSLRKKSVKLQSFRLVIWKLTRESIALSADIVGAIPVLTSLVLSFLKDQRSLNPSDILVLYFSASAMCALPRLRSLWIIHSVPIPRAIWTVITVGTVVVMTVESARKTRWLRSLYRQSSTHEQTAGFWSGSFFIWALPFFQAGYTKDLQLADIPPVDDDLKGQSNVYELQVAWKRVRARHRFRRHLLLQATFAANKWSFLSAVFGQLICLVSRAVYWRQTYRLVSRIRSGLTINIYRHITALPGRDVKNMEAVTLMGTNVERIVDTFTYIHELWASIIEVSIAIWLLTRQISLASLVPSVVCVASVFAASRVATGFGKAQKTWNERVEKRISATISMLGDMKSVKFLGLAGVISDIIRQYRDIELQTSEKLRRLRIWRILVSNTPTTIKPFCTLATYAAIAAARKDETLLSAQAFSSLSLISLVTNPLLTLCQVLPSFIQGISCFSRIESYCLKSGLLQTNSRSSQSLAVSLTNNSTELTELASALGSNDSLFVFDNADIAWSLEAAQPVLHSLSLTISRGLTAIIGPSASGKSTLLQSMIEETVFKKGSMISNGSRVAFCSQGPWIKDDTIRCNIIGGGRETDFDQKWYDFSLLACGLKHELESFPAGDQTFAGNNGVLLSGGQRQRVALARAVYSRLPVVILDDVMSGLDPKTTSTIVNHLFSQNGYFRKADISVIVATHNRQLLYHMDAVVVLEQGRSVHSVSYEETLARHDGLKTEPGASSIYASPVEVIDDDTEQSATHTPTVTPLHPPSREKKGNPDQAVNETQRQQATWSTYFYHGRSAGFWSMVLWITFTFVGAILTSLTNQFSQDIDLIDMGLPSEVIQFTTGAASCAVQLIVLCVMGKFLAAIIPVLAIALFIVQSYYLRTSRQVRLLDIETKAPVYKQFIETSHGVSTIRAFGWQDAFYEKQAEVIDQAQRPFYMLFCIQQWLELVLDLIIAALAVIIISIATTVKGSLSPGALGVALVIILQFNSDLSQTIQSWTKLETSIGAVARVQQFLQETPVEPDADVTPDAGWPLKGAIHFQDAVANYGSDDTLPAMANLNLRITPGEKIAICGPSGSGKSTLIMALARIIDLRNGKITVDEIDICTVSPAHLRSCLNIIPQEPFFIPGSIRVNIDPHNQHSDTLIESALRKVHLWERMAVGREGGAGTLDRDLIASEWSQGERQLLCLARALLVPSQILILDEATSSVDEGTATIMQEVVEAEFPTQTVISVLHRFAYINRYDRVAVLEQGRVVECDKPRTLLNRESTFREFYNLSEHAIQ
ncbi:hypothetical protein UA08_01294 [Talaromyces atroroseus]|uniref:Uncharacterized protein n=1 Tax=Talaromyces atroroseus TaxID=1441469 RepID=A0A1Q5QAP4_TALAT|nr:hypothetical protein UA08_01294 [Talaromyces atroroseus]OKL62878.1 hypothetical protein UA08_01294 [Talaromyces atroroseus]